VKIELQKSQYKIRTGSKFLNYGIAGFSFSIFSEKKLKKGKVLPNAIKLGGLRFVKFTY
jgi:hypothetical protein